MRETKRQTGASNKVTISVEDLIMPYFVIEGTGLKEFVTSMPGIARLSIDNLLKDIREAGRLGIKAVLLFGICPSKYKDEKASYASSASGVIPQAVAAIKQKIKDIVVITDACLCAYTTHGHCGVVKSQKENLSSDFIDNKKTLKVLSKITLTHAKAGADWVAPSAMAPAQVLAIRQALDKNGYDKVKIMGYSAKFASNFYGPFREAADSAPQFGNRRGYQLDYANALAPLREIAEDIKEGADMVMVKPALSYLDVIKEVKSKFSYPLAAYNVSGEYAFVKYGAIEGFWDEKNMVWEIITSIKRAGADFIITYHAKDIAKWLREN